MGHRDDDERTARVLLDAELAAVLCRATRDECPKCRRPLLATTDVRLQIRVPPHAGDLHWSAAVEATCDLGHRLEGRAAFAGGGIIFGELTLVP